MKTCKQCKIEKPESEYLPMKRGWKVVLCNDCACENVRRWSRKVELDADKVRRRAIDD